MEPTINHDQLPAVRTAQGILFVLLLAVAFASHVVESKNAGNTSKSNSGSSSPR